jgi:hypothetical protein
MNKAVDLDLQLTRHTHTLRSKVDAQRVVA